MENNKIFLNLLKEKTVDQLNNLNLDLTESFLYEHNLFSSIVLYGDKNLHQYLLSDPTRLDHYAQYVDIFFIHKLLSLIPTTYDDDFYYFFGNDVDFNKKEKERIDLIKKIINKIDKKTYLNNHKNQIITGNLIPIIEEKYSEYYSDKELSLKIKEYLPKFFKVLAELYQDKYQKYFKLEDILESILNKTFNLYLKNIENFKKEHINDLLKNTNNYVSSFYYKSHIKHFFQIVDLAVDHNMHISFLASEKILFFYHAISNQQEKLIPELQKVINKMIEKNINNQEVINNIYINLNLLNDTKKKTEYQRWLKLIENKDQDIIDNLSKNFMLSEEKKHYLETVQITSLAINHFFEKLVKQQDTLSIKKFFNYLLNLKEVALINFIHKNIDNILLLKFPEFENELQTIFTKSFLFIEKNKDNKFKDQKNKNYGFFIEKLLSGISEKLLTRLYDSNSNNKQNELNLITYLLFNDNQLFYQNLKDFLKYHKKEKIKLFNNEIIDINREQTYNQEKLDLLAKKIINDIEKTIVINNVNKISINSEKNNFKI